MKKCILVSLLMVLLWTQFGYTSSWVMSNGYIPEKGWSESKGPIVFGQLVPYPQNDNHCDGNDKSLKFNLSVLANNVGGSFDVNHIFVDGISTGEYALNLLQAEFAAHGQGPHLYYLLNKDWSQNGGYAYVCVGGIVQDLTTDSALQNIALWYDVTSPIGGPTKESEIPNGAWTTSGDVLSWHPRTSTCQNAMLWRRRDNQQLIANRNTQSVSGSNICSTYNVLPECIESTPSTCGSQGVSTTYFSTGVDTAVVPAPDEGFVDPVVNHKHAIGMDYVKYRMSGQSNWHEGMVTVNQGTNQNLHVRVKTKEKEGWEWTNIDVDLYYSENRWFSRSHDTLVATKRIDKLGKKEKESVYFNDISIAHLPVGHHYYFADIRYSRPGLSDHNISSRSDDTEYVVIDVQDPNKLPVGYVDVANCSTISGWAKDDDTSGAVAVHVYDGATFLGETYANMYRSDVGNHGFAFPIPQSHKDGTQHTYRVFAINQPQGNNPLVQYGTFTMACGNNGAMPTSRYYNSRVDAHYYLVNPIDQTRLPLTYNHEWEHHGFSFNAFPESQTGTVPLYTCWSGSTHDYALNLSEIGYHTECKEAPYRLFDVYPSDGPNRTPVYLMYKSSTDTFILSNGWDDAVYLRDTHGFAFSYTQPFFWAPSSLIDATVPVVTPPPITPQPQLPIDKSVKKREQFTKEEIMKIFFN